MSLILDHLNFKYCRNERELKEMLTEKVGVNIHDYDDYENIIKLYCHLHALDEATGLHSQEVAALCFTLARPYYSTHILLEVYLGGLIHDIGKIGFSKDMLEGKTLTEDYEKRLIQTHTVIGKKIVEEFTPSQIINDLVLNHHENLDGTGYPNQKKLADLSEFDMIIRVADMFSALLSPRKYRNRKAYSITEALQLLSDENEKIGQHVVYELCETFIQNKERIPG